MKTIVLKFGGSSVGSIDRIKKVCKIIIVIVKHLLCARVLELVDRTDLKSVGRKLLRVQVPSLVPKLTFF